MKKFVSSLQFLYYTSEKTKINPPSWNEKIISVQYGIPDQRKLQITDWNVYCRWSVTFLNSWKIKTSQINDNSWPKNTIYQVDNTLHQKCYTWNLQKLEIM